MKTLLIIAGPTAVGKTRIAIDVAKALGTEIISADSRQCYRGMAIGTAQPTPEELLEVKHHFIDEFPVTQNISAADYERLALGYLNALFTKQDVAVLAGGTGLYIRALCEGLDEMPAVDPNVLAQVETLYEAGGVRALQDAVATEDPAFHAQGEIQNPARLIRALSFVRSAGKSILEYHKSEKKHRPFRIIKTALELPRDILYQRINTRVDAMMAAGLPDEVKALIPYRHLKNLQTVGYTELFDFFDGHSSLHKAADLIRQHSRNYAKRQLTWFRKDAEMKWLRADDAEVARQIVGLL